MPAEASVANPVDMLGSATAEIYERALPIVLADPGIDAVIVLFVPRRHRSARGRPRCRARRGGPPGASRFSPP